MSNEGDKNVPIVPGKNPYEDYADRVDNQMLLGQLLKFSKGDWLIGRDGDACPHTELVALMQGLMHGWTRWEDSAPVEHIMGLLVEGFVSPARNKLSHSDKALWEPNADGGEPQDPWQQSVYLPMITIDGDAVFTFATSSDGGRRRAIAPLCREYGNQMRQHPNELPVVGLEQDSYQHPNRKIGRVKYPLLPFKRLVKAEPYFAAVMTLTGKSLKLALPSGKAA